MSLADKRSQFVTRIAASTTAVVLEPTALGISSLRSVQQAGVAYYVELLPRVVARGVRAIGRDARVVARGSVLIAAQPSGTASSLTSLCVGWARRTPCFWGSATVGMGNGLAAVGPEMLWYTGACFAGTPYADCSGGNRSVDVSFMECNLFLFRWTSGAGGLGGDVGRRSWEVGHLPYARGH